MAVNLQSAGLATLWLALLACPGTIRAQAPDQWRSGLPHLGFTAELATTLDTDNQADWIRAYPCSGSAGGAAFCVRIAVSQTRSTQTIVLDTNAKGVRIASHDVDGDHLQDVLIMDADDGSPLGVWINDGRGGFKESDVRSYPSSIWHEDPLLCQTRDPEHASPASMNGVQDLCLAPFALKAPLPEADRPFTGLEAACSGSASLAGYSGRAPPAR
jgi:hypothetical protein